MPSKAEIVAQLSQNKIEKKTVKTLQSIDINEQIYRVSSMETLRQRLHSLFFATVEALDTEKFCIYNLSAVSSVLVYFAVPVQNKKEFESKWSTADFQDAAEATGKDVYKLMAEYIARHTKRCFFARSTFNGYKYSYDGSCSIRFVTKCLKYGKILPENITE